MRILGKLTATWCIPPETMVKIWPKGLAPSPAQPQWPCGWPRSLTKTTSQTPVLMVLAFITPRSSGETPLSRVCDRGFSVTTAGGSLVATMIHPATISPNTLTNHLLCSLLIWKERRVLLK